VGLIAHAMPAMAQGTAFSYQGKLNSSGAAANGLYDFQFNLYDAASNGNNVSIPTTVCGVQVTNGLFTATLDYGTSFPGAPRWLEIAVRVAGPCTQPLSGFTTLSPRQQILAAPYAITATNASNVTGPISGSQIIAGSVSSTQLAAGAAAANLGPISGSQITAGSISSTQLAAGAAAANIGNSLTLSTLTVGSITFNPVQARRWSINGVDCHGTNTNVTGDHECSTTANVTTMYFSVSGLPDGAMLTSMQFIGIIYPGATLACTLTRGQFGSGTSLATSTMTGNGIWNFSNAFSFSHTVDQNENSYGIHCAQTSGTATTFGISFIKVDYTVSTGG
jgi:hypothetical protein